MKQNNFINKENSSNLESISFAHESSFCTQISSDLDSQRSWHSRYLRVQIMMVKVYCFSSLLEQDIDNCKCISFWFVTWRSSFYEKRDSPCLKDWLTVICRSLSILKNLMIQHRKLGYQEICLIWGWNIE
jgi:hypothetical protein